MAYVAPISRNPMPPPSDSSTPENGFTDGDPRVIEIDQAAERAYWCKSLDVTEAQLVAIVAAVGPLAQRVKDHLAALRERRQ